MDRIFFPGSEWLYIKLYAGVKTIDKLISTKLDVFITSLIDKNLISKWFFVRYNDPKYHIRIRVKLKSLNNLSEVMHIFHNIFNDELSYGQIYDLMIDSYKREVERYGIETMELSESIFYIDSEAACNLIKMTKDNANRDNLRWQLGLLLVDTMIEEFGYSLEEKIKLMASLSESFLKEFGFTHSTYTKQLNEKYRHYRSLIENVMCRTEVSVMEYYPVIHKRQDDLSIISKKIFDVADNLRLDNLLRSYIHMTMNRLFVSDNRANEMVLYYLLIKYYKSYKARIKFIKS